MSYEVIDNVGRTLMKMLWAAIQPVAATLGGITENDISLNSPVDLAGPTPQLSLFLYQVAENPYIKNRELIPGSTPNEQRLPPLSLVLHYLVTPFASNRDIEHLLLGRAMLAFYDRSILDTAAFADPAWVVPPELHIALAPLSLEDLTRIWGAFNQNKGYKLSVAYQVTPVPIESNRVFQRERVIYGETHYLNLRRIP